MKVSAGDSVMRDPASGEALLVNSAPALTTRSLSSSLDDSTLRQINHVVLEHEDDGSIGSSYNLPVTGFARLPVASLRASGFNMTSSSSTIVLFYTQMLGDDTWIMLDGEVITTIPDTVSEGVSITGLIKEDMLARSRAQGGAGTQAGAARRLVAGARRLATTPKCVKLPCPTPTPTPKPPAPKIVVPVVTTVAKVCPAGWKKDCKVVYRDQYDPNGKWTCNNECVICPIGTYSAVEGSENCGKCQASRWSDKEGATSCNMCPDGTDTYNGTGVGGGYGYTPATSASDCQPCLKGRYRNATSFYNWDYHVCEVCPGGSWSDVAGATQCKQCPEGTKVQANTGPKPNVDVCQTCFATHGAGYGVKTNLVVTREEPCAGVRAMRIRVSWQQFWRVLPVPPWLHGTGEATMQDLGIRASDKVLV